MCDAYSLSQTPEEGEAGRCLSPDRCIGASERPLGVAVLVRGLASWVAQAKPV